MATINETISPCKACGSEDIDAYGSGTEAAPVHHIKCQRCSLSMTQRGGTMADLVKVWNEYTPPGGGQLNAAAGQPIAGRPTLGVLPGPGQEKDA